jgi:hypothetical protein
MALGAVLAAALTDHSAHPWGLFIEGVDVSRQPGTAGNGYGVLAGSIRMTHAGPGSVSSMSFIVDDPANALTIKPMTTVTYYDFTLDYPVFTGLVLTPTASPMGVGKSVSVECIGAEAALDYATLTDDVTFAAGASWYLVDAMQSTLAQCEESFGSSIRAAFDNGITLGNQAAPLSNMLFLPLDTTATVTLPAGITLRTAFSQLIDNAISGGAAVIAAVPATAATAFVTIDFWMGLRAWIFTNGDGPGYGVPDDWTTLTVSDTYAGANVATNLQHTLDGGSLVAAVYVEGGNAAGTGLVRIAQVGHITMITDATILTAAAKDLRAFSLMPDNDAPARGTFVLSDRAGSESINPGGWLSLTDAQVGVTPVWPYGYRIGTINRTFLGNGLQTWTVTYGAAAPSYVDTI